jgi:hypothetical protein
MGQHIRGLTIRPIRLTPTEAELAIKVEIEHPIADADIHGRLMGPTCRYGSTVSVAYPIRQLPAETSGPDARIGRVIIPEPSWWDPVSPFLYGGPVELWKGGQTVERITARCGLHHATVNGGRLIWNGRPLELRAVTNDDVTANQFPAMRAADVNLVVVSADRLADLWGESDEIGILLAGRAADAAEQAARHSPFHHPSLLGFLSGAGNGSLHLTGGRGVLEFERMMNV